MASPTGVALGYIKQWLALANQVIGAPCKQRNFSGIGKPIAGSCRTARGAADLLFVKLSGGGWQKSDHARPFPRGVAPMGEVPAGMSSYALRHSHITAQLLAGLPVQLVAKLHDTSASQVEKHYAATIASHTDELVRASIMEVDRPAAEV